MLNNTISHFFLSTNKESVKTAFGGVTAAAVALKYQAGYKWSIYLVLSLSTNFWHNLSFSSIP